MILPNFLSMNTYKYGRTNLQYNNSALKDWIDIHKLFYEAMRLICTTPHDHNGG